MTYGKSKHACDPRGPHSPIQVLASRGSYSAARRMDRQLAVSGLTAGLLHSRAGGLGWQKSWQLCQGPALSILLPMETPPRDQMATGPTA